MGYENIKKILRNLQDDAPESNPKTLLQVLNQTVLKLVTVEEQRMMPFADLRLGLRI